MRRHQQDHLSVLSHTIDSQLKSSFLLDFSFIKADNYMTGLMDGACVRVPVCVSLCCINVQTLLCHLQFSYAEVNIHVKMCGCFNVESSDSW